ncbi:kinase-like protein [Nadsonia fulvescens var. elongata DSM 6958]|uniref:Kinase-like protein n=1 Tax=Nadsonia fulvescens var. elongata DSM 6958 TaxID=857566 RepID=A0A1E3PQ57_9ASCO|nr:kinase-like protein [Nadsonia fulvescens var. elongata DSM 6958]
MRLSYARKLIDPTMMMIDQMIDDFALYIRLAQATKERYLDFSTPVPEKGWVLPNFLDENFDATIIDCTKFYMELLQRKFLSNPKGNYSFRTFKEVEMLESEYLFLEEIGYWVDGGDIMIAEQFASLTTKLVARLLAYWENVSKLPEKLNNTELTKWYSAASDNVRAFQRKMVRFFNLLSASYANATDYHIQGSKMKNLVESLIQTGHFLVYTGNLEKDGMYAIADPSLMNQPQILKQIITGYSRRMPVESENYISYILLFCPQEPFVWGGEIYNLEMPDVVVDMKVGQMRLVSEGRFNELAVANQQFAALCGSDLFDVIVDFKSNLANVDNELSRMKKLFFKQAFSIVNSIALIRAKCKGRGCNDVVHQLFAFAREFGQRSLQIVDPSRRSILGMKLINLCIEWVSFICDDCDLTEYKTFRWTVTALEFSMVMTRGINVLALTDEQFSRLQVKVAGCMSLLISHFDIMGARSKAAAKEQQMAELARKKKVAYPNFKGDDDLMSIFREEAVKKLEILEQQRRELEAQQHMVGKVLDDSNMDTHFLSVLASSFSNVSIRWQQGKFVGGGTFGSVYAAVNLDTGGVMAVKEIRLQDTQSIRHIVKSIKDEMTVLEMLNHPNIVQYFGVEVHRDRVFIFMEYCQGGSLANLLEHGRIEDEQVMQVYTLQMLEGLAYLHQSGIVHRDIKPENVLLDHLGIIKFVDFGAAKVIAKTGRTKAADGTAASTRTKLNSMTGTPMYMSPEVITGSNPGRQGSIDVWSLGCCVLEMATGRRPWANLDNEWAIMYHIAAGHMPQMPSNDQISPAGRNFLMRCLQRDPSIRPSAVELLNDPWIIQTRLMALGSMDNLTPTSEGSDSSLTS